MRKREQREWGTERETWRERKGNSDKRSERETE